jgi:DNA polymerase elongation subunit (family B)
MLLMDGYPEGSNLTIMNAMYEKPHRDEDGNYVPDYLHIVFKDNETGLKHVQTIKEPTYTYYMAKDGVPITHNMEWIEASKVRPVTCQYSKIKESIARETGNLALFKENMRSGNYRLNDNFFAHPRVFSADMNILNYCRMEFANTYQNPVCPITVAYYDIENDIIDAVSDEPVIGDSPINIASIYFDATKTVYCFILRNGRNPKIAEFEEDINKHFKKYKDMMNNFIEENIGSRAKTEKYKLNDLELSVGFFDTERELIQTFFSVMKKLSPDFAVAYNSSYDLPYLLARGELFGLNPIDLISDDCFSRKFYYYFSYHVITSINFIIPFKRKKANKISFSFLIINGNRLRRLRHRRNLLLRHQKRILLLQNYSFLQQLLQNLHLIHLLMKHNLYILNYHKNHD